MSRTGRRTVKPPGFRGKFYQPPRTRTGGPRKRARCGKVTVVSRHGPCPECKKILGKWVWEFLHSASFSFTHLSFPIRKLEIDRQMHTQKRNMSQEKRLRFRIRTRDQEIELEGDFEYVRDKFENLVENLRLKDGIAETKPEPVQTLETSEPSDLLRGIVQFGGEGRPYLTVPADSLSAKEALALVLYATHPKTFGDDELSTLLGSSWKTTSGAVVRARASELKREGKLIAEKGSYVLSGAGVQWVTGEVIPGLKKTIQ